MSSFVCGDNKKTNFTEFELKLDFCFILLFFDMMLSSLSIVTCVSNTLQIIRSGSIYLLLFKFN